MAIILYKHNQDAYNAVEYMLGQEDRAAVVHPTGTGKSMIAFKLAELHPDQCFLWLSPSEYIARTQLENVLAADAAANFSHITFMTYARLMLLSPDALSELHPDFVILDEFHRCGAEMWGAGVERLLAAYPQARLLGLSATKIRYLDHQRDMVNELFDGHIASEMTLGEAVVRGILPAPKYITTIYQYQSSLELYEKRIKTLRNAQGRSRSEKYLQALRRTLENAEGLERVFAQHMTDAHGRYILFCASVSHLQEMYAHAQTWFASLDQTPHCYFVYADHSASSDAYDAFRCDDSPHLKLLFCVNMLNEGIHVEGISGVILFRPTVSPIIYKQQIGRALTSGSTVTPLILDVVNNVENLYSVDSIEQEMLEATCRLRESGKESLILHEHFQIIDQAQDCRQLFEQLESSLRIDWDEYYQAAVAYREEHGNLLIPQRYMTADGKCLGSWLATQRRLHSRSGGGALTEEQAARLEALGIVWENLKDISWEGYYRLAKAYYQEHGNLDVPQDYLTPGGQRLGVWLANMRVRHASLQAKNVSERSLDRIRRMEAIGMKWNTFDARWEIFFEAAKAYAEENGDLLVPVNFVTKDGIALGAWIANLRSKRKGTLKGRLLPEQIERLNGIGMVWDGLLEKQWLRYYDAARHYFKKHGDLSVSKSFQTPDGLKLGIWLIHQRQALKRSEVKSNTRLMQREKLLREIGIME